MALGFFLYCVQLFGKIYMMPFPSNRIEYISRPIDCSFQSVMLDPDPDLDSACDKR